ncbi:glucosylceramide synthase [Thecamonas trahens ATCC 50062]|uniref:ceramide glucosyltransferase n=1 Tax=Thecamonas trahens ATCC 50062 TaxID=461836 RepID=A0A0L0DFH0_THETB|nr:glucosylceramide synthase [Thecamonas trahens ATCC 50062]KNC50980.1 glucosylceramide synthase [Thecamonas trahens ATCC 50062]|eukprot:XP_013756451.1 glucosylceramide synthase [Thecamonas trahens ATCC 50062]
MSRVRGAEQHSATYYFLIDYVFPSLWYGTNIAIIYMSFKYFALVFGSLGLLLTIIAVSATAGLGWLVESGNVGAALMAPAFVCEPGDWERLAGGGGGGDGRTGNKASTSLTRSESMSASLGDDDSLPGISVLKPLCGVDSMLETNLETFFQLEYPEAKFELVFSVTEATDPALEVVRSLMVKYPKVHASIVVADPQVGYNPKLNNLIVPFDRAEFDLCLCSDSNVYAEPDLLTLFASEFDDDVGFLHQMPVVSKPGSWGAWLEYTYVNATILPMFIVGTLTPFPCVWGKSFAIRRSDVNSPHIGGLASFGNCIAEDLAISTAMHAMRLRVKLMRRTVVQRLGVWSFTQFWERSTRWLKYRKAMGVVMGGFTLEWVFYGPVIALFAGLSWAWLMGGSFVLPALSAFALLGLLAYAFVRHIDNTLAGPPSPLRFAASWIAVQALLIPMWITVMLSRRDLQWRGKAITLAPNSHLPVKKER